MSSLSYKSPTVEQIGQEFALIKEDGQSGLEPT